MTEQNVAPGTTPPDATAVHHQTKRAADLALAKKAISPDSHKAVQEGRISLDEARELGRNAGPSGPAVRVNKNDRTRPCACQCGEYTGSTWKQGHDARLPGLVLQSLKGEIELTDEQREHAERRDLFAKAEAKLAEKALRGRKTGRQKQAGEK